MLPDRAAVVRLTEDAIGDLQKLHKKDPNIVRAMFKKMLLLERSPEAGEPLLGAFMGFRKLTVGDRTWRIVWRVTEDSTGQRVLEVAEIWAAGAREDAEIYKELTERIATLRADPKTRPLADVVAAMGRPYRAITATAEPPEPTMHPAWLIMALKDQLGMGDDEIRGLTTEEAQQRLMRHWSSEGR